MELILDYNKRYTYADYLTWVDDKMRELINGFVRLMSPAPASLHQIVSGELFGDLQNIVEKNKINS